MRSLTGTGRLVRFLLRRDRLRFTLWVLGLAGLLVGSGLSLLGVYPDQDAIDSYVRFVGDNPATIAFAGPGYGFDDPNIGVILVNETQIFGAIGLALMSLFLFVRHTRGEEDSERAELVGSNVVGRHALTTAAAIVVASANVTVGVLAAAGFAASGYPPVGSIALAASMACVGLVFVGVAAVAAQAAGSSRAALGLGTIVLGVVFTLRAVGDIGDNGWRWASPMGWAIAVRAFAGERWFTLLPCLVVAVGLVVLAFWLSIRRDLGAGLLPARLGRSSAPVWMTTPLGLAVRLQRGALIGWMIGMFFFGVLYGSLGNDIDEMLEDNPQFADFFAQLEGASLIDSYFATTMVLQALVIGGFTISSVLRLRTEEGAGRLEAILATPTSRNRWAASHVTMAVVGTILTVSASGLGTGIGYAVVVDDASQVLRLLGAALVTVPAVLVLGALALLLFGLRPQVALGAWAFLAIVAVIGYLGDLLRLPEWLEALSPMDHLPAVPAHDLSIVPLMALTLVAVALGWAGLWGFGRRDVNAP